MENLEEITRAGGIVVGNSCSVQSAFTTTKRRTVKQALRYQINRIQFIKFDKSEKSAVFCMIGYSESDFEKVRLVQTFRLIW